MAATITNLWSSGSAAAAVRHSLVFIPAHRPKKRVRSYSLDRSPNAVEAIFLIPNLGSLRYVPARFMVLVIDNYDSFTYNLVQYLGEMGVEMQVQRNDQISLDQISALKPERILVSPGPCSP